MSKGLRRSIAMVVVLLTCLPVTALTQPATTAVVRGVLLDTSGLPAQGFQLGLKTTDGNLFLSQPTGADGAFAIEGLPPATYQLAAFAPDGGEIPVIAKPVALSAGQQERVEIRLSTDKATVAGRPPAADAGAIAPAPAQTSSVGWANVGWAALAIAGAFAIGYWVFDDDEVKRNKPIPSPYLPPGR